MLTEAQQATLDDLRARNQAAGFPFTAELHWQWVNRLFEQWFQEDGIGDVIYQRFNDHFAGLPAPEYQQQWAEHLKEQLGYKGECNDIRHLLAELLTTKDCYSAVLLASHLGVDSRNLHWDLLTACESLDFLKRNGFYWYYDMPKVFDLGGGWGRIGCALRTLKGDSIYIDCDLPESLLIASEFLPRILDEPARLPLEQFDLEQPGIYFISPQTILEIPDKSLDLIINIASFQEMPREQIEAYYKIIDKKARYLYTLQYAAVGISEEFVEPLGWKLVAQSAPYWGKAYTQALYEL